MKRERTWAIAGAALVALGFALWAAPRAEAQPISCTAALDVDIHYCRDTQGPPDNCVPSAFTDGMPVEITIEVTNDSEHQDPMVPPPDPRDPPAGNLLGGQTIKVYYSCSSPVCAAGDELPGDFEYVSHTTINPGVQFVDDGNGYSGTITILNDAAVVWPETDPFPARDLVKIRTIARRPPGAGIVYARAGQPTPPANDGSSNILEITDPECLGAPLMGGGQGSTAGQFASGQCQLVPFCTHPCPSNINFDHPQDGMKPFDFLFQRMAIIGLEPPPYDPEACDFTYTLSNAGGVLFTQTLAPGDIAKASKSYIFQDKQAQDSGGIQRLELRPFRDVWTFRLKAYEDLVGADDPTMRVTVQTCGYVCEMVPPTRDWLPRPADWMPGDPFTDLRGWTLPGEPLP